MEFLFLVRKDVSTISTVDRVHENIVTEFKKESTII